MAKRSNVKIQTTVYKSFKGVDFTTDPSLVDRSRSPMAVNMLSDEGGIPEKRVGYRIESQYNAAIYGIHVFNGADERVSDLSATNSVGESVTVTVNPTTLYSRFPEYGEYVFTIEGHPEMLLGGTDSLKISVNGDVAIDKHDIGGTGQGAVQMSYYLAYYGLTVPDNAWQNGGVCTIQFFLNYERCYLIHSGVNLYRLKGSTNTLMYSNMPEEPSQSVYMNGKLWLFSGKEYLVFDGTDVVDGSTDAYVPTTVIGCVAGSTPGGTTYEALNYLSDRQRVGFLAKNDSQSQPIALYTLPYKYINYVVSVVVDGEVVDDDYYTVDTENGTVTFVSGHIPTPPAAGQEDNVFITFSKHLDGYGQYINPIRKCKVCTLWGHNGAEDRIVCSGNGNYKNRDFTSGYKNPTYFPDSDYQVVGSETSAVVGYLKRGSELLIVKEDNGKDSSVFVRSSTLGSDGSVSWQTYPCIAGVGAMSRFGFGHINDDQLILTANGVYAVTTNSLTAEKIAECRSIKINPKLTEESLPASRCVSFKNLFIAFFPNGHTYILDGKQARSYEGRNDTNFTYEGYYWENCPATYATSVTANGLEYLYFGTADGRLCKFLWGERSYDSYSDEMKVTKTGGSDTPFTINYNGSEWKNGDTTVTLSGLSVVITFTPIKYDRIVFDGDNIKYYRAINAVWATKADDDGDPMILKTMLKKGNAVTLMPCKRSSAQVNVRTDKDTVDWQCNYGQMDVFDWEDIDFERFTFNTNDSPREIPFNRKVKNYKRLQIIIRNTHLNEGFGIYGIVKHYVTGNFAKR